MEKSLKYSGILSVSPYGIYLKNAGDTTLDNAFRTMLGAEGNNDIPCELLVTVNRYDDCYEINGEKCEVKERG